MLHPVRLFPVFSDYVQSYNLSPSAFNLFYDGDPRNSLPIHQFSLIDKKMFHAVSLFSLFSGYVQLYSLSAYTFFLLYDKDLSTHQFSLIDKKMFHPVHLFSMLNGTMLLLAQYACFRIDIYDTISLTICIP